MDATLNTDTTVKKFHLKATGTFVDAQVENAIRYASFYVGRGMSNHLSGRGSVHQISMATSLMKMRVFPSTCSNSRDLAVT